MNFIQEEEVQTQKTELKNKKGKIFCSIEYLPKEKIVYANWKGNLLPLADVKAGTLMILKVLEEHKASLLLNDNRELADAWDVANDWIAATWMPKAIKIGLKKFAHILSEDLFAQLSAEFMQDKQKEIKAGFELEIFNTYDNAKRWLLK